MNGPSLQRLTILSLVFHVTFFSAVFLTLKKSNDFVMPSPYIVNLVSPDVGEEPKPSAYSVDQSPVEKTPSEVSLKEKDDSQKVKTKARADEQLLSEKIAALKAQKKVERIVRLRNVISLKRSGGENKAAASQSVVGKRGGSIMDDYYSRIMKEIWENWGWPGRSDGNLEAIVSIKILKDGSVKINGIEKRSGNALFDRFALNAVTKASPLTPPPYEMEIGLRFYP